MRTTLTVLLVLLMGAPVVAQSGRRQRGGNSDALSSDYGALLENNIFLRDRGRRPVSPTTRPSAPPLTREQTLILTGIVLEQGQFRAYFEDTRSDSIVRVAEGDPIASGTVGEILFNAVAYQTPEGMRWIDIGYDLTASIPASRGSSLSSAPALDSGGDTPPTGSTGASEAQPGPSDPALMSVEERMRQRAQQMRNR